MPFSGMWRRVVLVWTDVSEDHIVSIFRVEESANEEPDQSATTSSRWSLTLRIFYAENGGDTTLRNVGLHKSTWRRIPENGILNTNIGSEFITPI
jgi:hypothetical protein